MLTIRRKRRLIRNLFASITALLLLATTLSLSPDASAQVEQIQPSDNFGAVYVQTNALNGNEIAAFERSANGQLAPIGNFSTGGNGSTEFDGGEGLDPLISADSVIVTDDERFLLTVNAGSDSISAFEIQDDFSLELVSVVPSGGVGPNSLAYDNGRVFVTNIDRDGFALGDANVLRAEPNDEGNVVGFTLAEDGTLSATGAVANLDNRPANIDFSLDGSRLIVSSITSGSAALPGPNAEASIYVFNINGPSLTLADTGTSTERGEGSTPDVVTVSVENLQSATGGTLDEATGFFSGDFDLASERFPTNSGFFFTEPWVGFHNGQFDLFDVGSPASSALQQVAETGSADEIFDGFAAAVGDGPRAGFQAFAENESGVQWISPGEIANTSFEILSAANYRFFSYASMIIPTNDAFIANDNPWAHEVFDADGNFTGPVTIEITAADIYDAGTELNDGQGAAGFSLGIGGSREASNSGSSTDTFGQGNVVQAHPGLDNILDFNTVAGTTITDLLDADEPIARITIDVEAGQVGRNLPSAIDFDIAQINGNEYVVVTEAREFNAQGAPPAFPALQAGSVSVYALGADSRLTLTTDDFAFGDSTQQNEHGANGQQLTACWIDFGADGSTFFVANAINSSISSLTLNADGTVTVLDTIAAQGTSAFQVPGQPIGGPEAFGRTDGFIDLDVSPDGQYLYQLAGLSGSVIVYQVGNHGDLTLVQELTGALPDIDTQGLISVGPRTIEVPDQPAPADGVYVLENVETTRVLDADSGRQGFNVETSTTAAEDDKWELVSIEDGLYNLRNLAFDRWLDADSDNGVETSSQARSDDRWELVPAGDGNWYLRNVDFDGFLTVGPGKDVNLSTPTSTSLWTFVPVEASPVDSLIGQDIALQNVGTGRYLDTDNRGRTHPVDTSVTQRADDVWTVEDAGDGFVLLRNDVTGRYLDADGSRQNFNVETSTTARSDDRWLFVEVDGGYALQNVDYGRYLYAGDSSVNYNVMTSDTASASTTWVVTIIG